MSKLDYPHKGQITLESCKELVAGLEPGKYHLYYKRMLDEKNHLQEYLYTDGLEDALEDTERYGSLFLRLGGENNWSQQYQIVDNNSLEPI